MPMFCSKHELQQFNTVARSKEKILEYIREIHCNLDQNLRCYELLFADCCATHALKFITCVFAYSTFCRGNVVSLRFRLFFTKSTC